MLWLFSWFSRLKLIIHQLPSSFSYHHKLSLGSRSVSCATCYQGQSRVCPLREGAVERSDTRCLSKTVDLLFIMCDTVHKTNSSSVGNVTTGKQHSDSQVYTVYFVPNNSHWCWYRTTFLLLSCFWVVMCLYHYNYYYLYFLFLYTKPSVVFTFMYLLVELSHL